MIPSSRRHCSFISFRALAAILALTFFNPPSFDRCGQELAEGNGAAPTSRSHDRCGQELAEGNGAAPTSRSRALQIEKISESSGLEELSRGLISTGLEEEFDRRLRAIFEATRDFSDPMKILKKDPLFPSRKGQIVEAAREVIQKGTLGGVRMSGQKSTDNAFLLLEDLMMQEPSAWHALYELMANEPESPNGERARTTVRGRLERELVFQDKISTSGISSDLLGEWLQAVSDGQLYFSILVPLAEWIAIQTGGPEKLADLLEENTGLKERPVKAIARALAQKRPKLLLPFFQRQLPAGFLELLTQELVGAENHRKLIPALLQTELPLGSLETVVKIIAAQRDGRRQLEALVNGTPGAGKKAIPLPAASRQAIRRVLANRSGLEEDKGEGLDRFGEGRRNFLKLLGVFSAKLSQVDQRLTMIQKGIGLLGTSIVQRPDQQLLVELLESTFPGVRSPSRYLHSGSPERSVSYHTYVTQLLTALRDRMIELQGVAAGKRSLPSGHLISRDQSPDYLEASHLEHRDRCPYCFAQWVNRRVRYDMKQLEEITPSFLQTSEQVIKELQDLSKERLLQLLNSGFLPLRRTLDLGSPTTLFQLWGNVRRQGIGEGKRIQLQQLIEKASAKQLQQWLVEMMQGEIREYQSVLEALRPLAAEVLEPLPGLLERVEPIAAKQNEALDFVEKVKKSVQANGVWHVVSAQAVKEYPGLTAHELPNLILDDESHSQAILKLMERAQPIEKIHYHGTESEIYNFYGRMMRQPSPIQELTWKWD